MYSLQSFQQRVFFITLFVVDLHAGKLDSPALKRACQRPIGNKHKKPYKPMLPETQQLLREFYRPYNEELAQMLNDQKYLWEDTQKT